MREGTATNGERGGSICSGLKGFQLGLLNRITSGGRKAGGQRQDAESEREREAAVKSVLSWQLS